MHKTVQTALGLDQRLAAAVARCDVGKGLGVVLSRPAGRADVGDQAGRRGGGRRVGADGSHRRELLQCPGRRWPGGTKKMIRGSRFEWDGRQTACQVAIWAKPCRASALSYLHRTCRVSTAVRDEDGAPRPPRSPQITPAPPRNLPMPTLPETATRRHYFIQHTRNFARTDADMTGFMRSGSRPSRKTWTGWRPP